MNSNGDTPVNLSLELAVVYLTVVARTVRQLDKAHFPGSTDLFLKALERSMEAEIRLSRPDEVAQSQLSELQKVSFRLVRMIPPDEDL